MTKKTFKEWIKVLKKINKRNKKMLDSNKITKEEYILLNRINLDRYEQIIKEYQWQQF